MIWTVNLQLFDFQSPKVFQIKFPKNGPIKASNIIGFCFVGRNGQITKTGEVLQTSIDKTKDLWNFCSQFSIDYIESILKL